MSRTGRKGGMVGGKTPIPEDYAFATSGEIAGRDSEAKQNAPTTFNQIGPADNAGRNVATMDSNPENKSGRFKFTPGP